jgi:hypothetical protein
MTFNGDPVGAALAAAATLPLPPAALLLLSPPDLLELQLVNTSATAATAATAI